MKSTISQDNLLSLLANRIPEAQREFSLLSDDITLANILNKVFDVTDLLISQHKFRAVKRCLLAVEELLLNGNQAIRNAVRNVYMYRLATLLYQRDAQSELIHFLLPPTLRREYDQNTFPDE